MRERIRKRKDDWNEEVKEQKEMEEGNDRNKWKYGGKDEKWRCT